MMLGRATTTEPSGRISAFSGFLFLFCLPPAPRGIQPITSAPAGEYNQSPLLYFSAEPRPGGESTTNQMKKRRVQRVASHVWMCVFTASAGLHLPPRWLEEEKQGGRRLLRIRTFGAVGSEHDVRRHVIGVRLFTGGFGESLSLDAFVSA